MNMPNCSLSTGISFFIVLSGFARGGQALPAEAYGFCCLAQHRASRTQHGQTRWR